VGLFLQPRSPHGALGLETMSLAMMLMLMLVVQYVEELMLLTMSDVERGVYDNCHSMLEKRQMCCHLQVVERLQKVMGNEMMTLNEVKDVMIAHTNQVSSHPPALMYSPVRNGRHYSTVYH